jgi:aryl-alcohol dehydrogenase-like predicted oxidoreductase
MLSRERQDESFALLDAVVALGGNTLDTAHSYGNGDTERLIGQWMEARGNRDQVNILTKGAHPSADRKRVTPFDIAADLHDSLARLKTGHVEIYLLHRDDESLPVGPIVEALNEHHAAGRIGIFGGSNWTPARLQEANDYAAAHGLAPFTASSPNFSLAEQVAAPWAGCLSIGGPGGAADRAWYAQNQMALFPWSSLAGGFFSGRFRRDNLAEFTDGFDEVCARAYGHEVNFQRLERAQSLAAQMGVTAPQIALAYVLHHGLNIFPLVGCRTPQEFEDNVRGSNLELSPEQVRWLDTGMEL